MEKDKNKGMNKIIDTNLKDIETKIEVGEWHNAGGNKKMSGMWEVKRLNENIRLSVAIMGTFDIEWGIGFKNKLRFPKVEAKELIKFLEKNKDKF